MVSCNIARVYFSSEPHGRLGPSSSATILAAAGGTGGIGTVVGPASSSIIPAGSPVGTAGYSSLGRSDGSVTGSDSGIKDVASSGSIYSNPFRSCLRARKGLSADHTGADAAIGDGVYDSFGESDPSRGWMDSDTQTDDAAVLPNDSVFDTLWAERHMPHRRPDPSSSASTSASTGAVQPTPLVDPAADEERQALLENAADRSRELRLHEGNLAVKAQLLALEETSIPVSYTHLTLPTNREV